MATIHGAIVVSLTDPNGSITRAEYDAARRRVVTTSPGTAAAPGGIVTTNSYDADGRLLQVQQITASGTVLRTTSASWTPTGKLATATDANGNVTRYDYDLLDRQVTLTDAMGRVTKSTYDNVNRPLQTSNPEIRKPALPTEVAPLFTQAWTKDSKLASLTDANGNTTSFEYDDFNRLKKTIYPDPITGAAGTTEEYTYDDVDNVLTRKTRAGGTFTFGYDTLYRLTAKTPPSGPVVTYGYDLASRPTGISDTSAAIAAAVPPGGSTVTYGTTYTYDALNRPTKVVWDPAPAVTAPTAGTLVTFGHSYDKTNRRIGQTVDDNTWLAYPAGAPSTTSYTADKLNRYSAVTGLTLSYDNNGNLTGDGTYTYGYDPENRMTSATGAGNSSTFIYDGRGWRKSRTVNGTTTVSVTDNANREVLEYDGSTGAVLRWYAYGLGPNDVLNQMNVPANTRAAFAPDLQGSVIGTFNSAGVLSKAAYLAYGGSAAAATPFGYTGQRLDGESGGLYYYRARHYSPLLGRFAQPDPLGYSTGENLYVYVANDPLTRIDPSGLQDISDERMGHILSAHGANSLRTRARNSKFTLEYSFPTELRQLPKDVFADPGAPSVAFPYGGLRVLRGEVLIKDMNTGNVVPYMIGVDLNGRPTNQVEIRYLPSPGNSEAGDVQTMFPVPMSGSSLPPKSSLPPSDMFGAPVDTNNPPSLLPSSSGVTFSGSQPHATPNK